MLEEARSEPDPAIPAWTLLRVWAGIGLQSFGGGASTQLLIRRVFVERRAWIGAEELARMWNLCVFTPGINLLALTVLIGRRLGGARGVVASLAGMLLPSAVVTVALAASFVQVRHSTVVAAVLRGVIPATAGIMLVVGLGFAQPLLRRARREGMPALVLSVAMIAAATLALVMFKTPVAAVLLAAGLIGVTVFTRWRRELDRAESGSPVPDRVVGGARMPEQAIGGPPTP